MSDIIELGVPRREYEYEGLYLKVLRISKALPQGSELETSRYLR